MRDPGWDKYTYPGIEYHRTTVVGCVGGTKPYDSNDSTLSIRWL